MQVPPVIVCNPLVAWAAPGRPNIRQGIGNTLQQVNQRRTATVQEVHALDLATV